MTTRWRLPSPSSAGDRYGSLVDALVDAAREPRLANAASGSAADVLPALVGKAWRRLAKAVEGLGRDPADERLHEVRILAKRARYAADVAVPVVGKPAKQLSSHLGDLQDALGASQDGAVAESWLRAVVPSLTKQQALVAGQLVVAQRQASAADAEWRPIWKRASDKRATAWLR